MTSALQHKADAPPSLSGVVARQLLRWGMRRAFCMLSHHITDLVVAMEAEGVMLHLATSETGAGYLADGLARSSGRPGLVVCGGGPCLALLLPALQTALIEEVPLLALVGQSPTRGGPRFQLTGPDGSDDARLIDALLGEHSAIDSPVDLLPALTSARRILEQRRPWVITIAADLQSLPIPDPTPLPVAGPTCSKTDARSLWHSMPCDPADGVNLDADDTSAYVRVFTTLHSWLPSEAAVFVDAGQARHAARLILPARKRVFFDCPRTGPMGWAIAASIGAALDCPHRPTVCVVGDGSLLLRGHELVTAVRYRANLAVVVCANGVYGNPYARHRRTRTVDLARLPAVDWLAWASAIGLPARRLGHVEDLVSQPSLAEGPRLFVVEVPEHDAALKPPYTRPAMPTACE